MSASSAVEISSLSAIQMPGTSGLTSTTGLTSTSTSIHVTNNIQIQTVDFKLNAGIPPNYANDLCGRFKKELKLEDLSAGMIPTLLRMGAEYANGLPISGAEKTNLVMYVLQVLIQEAPIDQTIKQGCMWIIQSTAASALNELVRAARGQFEDTLAKAKEVGLEVVEVAAKTKCFGLCA